MAAKKISEFDAATEFNTGDVLLGNDGSLTKKFPYATVVGQGVVLLPPGTDALQGAITQAAADGKALRLLPGTHTLTTGVTIDISTLRHVDFGYADVDASGISSGAAITITGSQSSGYGLYDQNIATIENLRLLGNGIGGSVTGLDLVAGASLAGPNHFVLRNIFLKEFGIGEGYGNNAYIVKHYNFNVYYCGTAIKVTAQANSGENLAYYGGSVSANDIVLSCDDANAYIAFHGCDHNFNGNTTGVWYVMTGGHAFFTDCNIEGATTADEWFQLTGTAGVVIRGGFMIGSAGTAVPALFSIGATSRVLLDRPWMYGFRNNDEVLATVTSGGRIVSRGIRCNAVSDLPYVLTNDFDCSLFKGDFEGATSDQSMIWVYGATDFSNRLTGTNLVLANSAGAARTGTRSLAATKSGGAAAAASFFIDIPITDEDAIYSWSMWVRDVGGAIAGNVDVVRRWLAAYPAETGLPGWTHSSVIGTISNVDPSDTWQQIADRPHGGRPAPAWSTHFSIEVKLTDMANGTIYFDDIIVSRW